MGAFLTMPAPDSIVPVVPDALALCWFRSVGDPTARVLTTRFENETFTRLVLVGLYVLHGRINGTATATTTDRVSKNLVFIFMSLLSI